MGIVWRARDERLERVVAIKQLVPQPGLTEQQKQDARRRAMREARIAARLHHPNAIVVFDIAEHDGDPCLVMEYIEGRSLAAVLADRGSLPVEEVVAMGGQIASALAAAHRSGIVHRDVKPGNVLLDANGTAKITDFGIARATGDITVTQSGVFAGTPAYLAPEVARGQEPTPASDVFSFGATLYDAIEGGPPFPERQNQLALLRLVAEGKVQPPRQAGILTALLMKLLRDEPDVRPTMAQATAMLAELAGPESPRPRVSNFTPAATKPDLVLPADPPAGTPAPVSTPAPSLVPTIAGANPGMAAGPAQQLPHPTPTAYAAAPPAPARPRQPMSRRATIVLAVAIVVVLAGFGVLLAINLSGNDRNGTASGRGGSSTTTNTTHPPTTSPSTGSTSAATQDITDYGTAGQMVVNFYGDLPGNPAAAWALLTPAGQQYYGGSEAQFAQYWSQYTKMYPKHATAVPNPDGSVTMSIEIHDAASPVQVLQMRVVLENGSYLIDGNSKLTSS